MGHTNDYELSFKVAEATKQVSVGEVYRHYKDPTLHYKVVAIGFLEENEGICVVYQALYGAMIVWVRTLEDWLSKVKTEKGEVPRFQKI
jgi:hypothetical protein